MNDLDNQTIPYEFLNRAPEMSDTQDEQLRTMIEQAIAKLAKDHHDITGAAVALEPVAQNGAPFVFRGRVVLYMRPENIAGVAEHDTPEGALRGALHAVERQVREARDKLRERYKQP